MIGKVLGTLYQLESPLRATNVDSEKLDNKDKCEHEIPKEVPLRKISLCLSKGGVSVSFHRRIRLSKVKRQTLKGRSYFIKKKGIRRPKTLDPVRA